MPVVTAIISGGRILSASDLYRISIPFHYIKQDPEWEYNIVMFENIAQRGPEWFISLVLSSDLIVLPRWTVRPNSNNDIIAIIDQIKAVGKKIIYETDDDMTNQFRTVTDGECIEILRRADGITVTTPILGERLTKLSKVKHYVVPNSLDPEIWIDPPAPKRLTDKPVIALTGSPTHDKDWEVLEHVLPRIANEFDVHIVIAGFHPDYLQGIPGAILLPPCIYNDYSLIIRGSDIILAPVDPNDRFNDGKSAIKATEGQGANRLLNGSAAGAAVIATRNKIYSQEIVNNRTGLLVQHTPEAWYNAICKLLNNPPLRHKIQRLSYQYAWEHRNIVTSIDLWKKAYRNILNE